ncbi:MAG: SAM-dependent methyltransferase [Polaribacter sp.]|jgi:SAM-dependent methyltransferase
MNRILYLFIFSCLFFNNSCTSNYDTGTRHPNQQAHGYDDGHNHEAEMKANSRLQDKYQDTNVNAGEGGNRWIWQKPNVIIEKLQPLDGKVLADIGAGPYGYFAFRIVHQTEVAKVIAIEISPEATKFMDDTKKLLSKNIQDRVETRLVKRNDPQLKKGEADVILIVNTVGYIENRIEYFQRLNSGMAEGGKLVIVDFKKRNTPVGPPLGERVSLGQIEGELKAAGYKRISVDDRALEYQYIVTADMN